jgi:acetoin utilization deacetylase AcuC-like enzyme
LHGGTSGTQSITCGCLAERFKRVPSRQATEAELLTVHTRELVAQVAAVSSIAARNMAEGRPLYLQNDTYANPHTYTCARLSAGSCAEAAVRVARGEARFGAAIVRPPGESSFTCWRPLPHCCVNMPIAPASAFIELMCLASASS